MLGRESQGQHRIIRLKHRRQHRGGIALSHGPAVRQPLFGRKVAAILQTHGHVVLGMAQ